MSRLAPHRGWIQEQLRAGISKAAIARELNVSRTTLRDYVASPAFQTTNGVDSTLATVNDDSLRILAIDIETRPNLAYVWGIWQQNIGISQIVESVEVICWVAKWIGEPEIEFRSVHHDTHDEMVRRAWTLLDEADVVLHYNGRKFDVPHLNREFVQLGLTPPSPYKQIDLLTTAKREFMFPSNKLAYVSEALGLEGKVQHEGFSLWVKCMAGDDEAWSQMREYNVRDVTLLEELYEKLRPWIRSHPSVSAHKAEDVCPGCGSEALLPHGVTVLQTGRYQRYHCNDCGKWSRGTKRMDKTAIVAVPNT